MDALRGLDKGILDVLNEAGRFAEHRVGVCALSQCHGAEAGRELLILLQRGIGQPQTVPRLARFGRDVAFAHQDVGDDAAIVQLGRVLQ